MTINGKLLQDALAAGTRLQHAENETQAARAEYHSIVRRMHLAGGSCREIAQALGLSHQRVQQMVQGAGGSWWARIWSTRRMKGNLLCTFCGRGDMAKLIAGPKIYICDLCVAEAERRIAGNHISARDAFLSIAPEGSRAGCSFCGKGNTNGRKVLISSAGKICSECLNVCRQILSDSASQPVVKVP
jgi:hypothetical protein